MRERLIGMLQEIHASFGSLRESNVCDDEVLEMLESFADHLGIKRDEYEFDDDECSDDAELDEVSLYRYVAQADRLTDCLQQLREWRYGENTGGDTDA